MGALGVIALASGCGREVASSGPPAQGSTANGAVIDAYEGYWSALVAASSGAKPESFLASVAAGEELAKATQMLASRQAAGETLRGRYEHDVVVRRMAGGSAVVDDCLVARLTIVDTKTGATVSKAPLTPIAVTATLVLDGAVWKVNAVAPAKTACSGANASPGQAAS